MNDEKLKWKLLKSEHIVHDQWIDFRRETYEFPDGTSFGPYYNYSRKSYAVIIAKTTEGKYLCVRQYRHGIKKITTEFPAGGIEAEGNIDEAAALHAAKRELQEETGYASENWTHLIDIPNDATLGDNYGYVFYAGNCYPVSDQKLDDTEFVERIQLTADEIENLISKGKFQQAVHVMAWYYLKDQRQKDHEK